ncbi:ATP-binding protein [Aquabacterium sp. NJ1]|uniref:ATP-binding protein n=1 Tax=Aquabacterium sp. NJ1 TaxID=1538295 RepID=UPI000690872D|nr:ATP-binding protein [Aquabacterium sp. NJ1]
MKRDLSRTLAGAAARTIEAELEWLASCLQARLSSYFGQPPSSPALPQAGSAPALNGPDRDPNGDPDCPYSATLRHLELDETERLLVALALAHHLRPQLLDVLSSRNEVTQRPYTEFGLGQGAVSGQANAPTGETACFLLAGDDMPARLQAIARLAPEGRLAQLGGSGVLRLAAPAPGERPLSGALTLSPGFLAQALPGLSLLTRPDQDLPAQRVQTTLAWSDLVLPAPTLEQLDDIGLWLNHGQALLHEWGMARRIAPGYVCLFHGPPGTGKTLSAGLLGQRCGREVWRVDLSQVVSKYIGETEKNLGRVFEAAEQHQWILFFDEADALFGKRTSVADAHDRYANQEISYLLQRIEDYAGVVILASNLRHNIDDAFLRRFQSVLHFALPRAPERLRLWREAFPPVAKLAPDLDLPRLAQQHEISGGTIMNVVRYACLRALARGDQTVRAQEVEEGLRRELLKEGRSS